MTTTYSVMACQGKHAFTSKDHADIAAKRRKGATAYKCRSCGDWHVGGKFWTNGESRGRKKKRMSGKARSMWNNLKSGHPP